MEPKEVIEGDAAAKATNEVKEKEPKVIVDEHDAKVVAYADSLEDRRLLVAGTFKAAQDMVSFSEGQASFLAFLQADFRSR